MSILQPQPNSQATMTPLTSNSVSPLTRSDSTSTMILCLEENDLTRPLTTWRNSSAAFRSLLKTSGLFNDDLERSDKLNEFLLSNDGQFTLHRLLSNNDNTMNLDLHELLLDSKLFECMPPLNPRSISELFQTDCLDATVDEMTPSAAAPSCSQGPPSVVPSHVAVSAASPSMMMTSSSSFCELRSVSPELMTDEAYNTEREELKQQPSLYGRLDAMLDTPMSAPVPLPSPPTSSSLSHVMCSQTAMSAPPVFQPALQHFTFEQNTSSALAAFEHDHAFLSKKTSVAASASNPSRKRARTSARMQSTASSVTTMSTNDTSCSSPLALLTPSSEEGSVSPTKRTRLVNRAQDIQCEEDLSRYLERRRKNNEASKQSRAAKKQKFGSMDSKCEEYERVNEELRVKIATLEAATATLKSGLIQSFGNRPRV